MATFVGMRTSIMQKLGAIDVAGRLQTRVGEEINNAYDQIMAFDEWVWAKTEWPLQIYAPLTQANGGTLVWDTDHWETTNDVGWGDDTHADYVGMDVHGWVLMDDVRRDVSSADYNAIDNCTDLGTSLAWPDTTDITTYTLYCKWYQLDFDDVDAWRIIHKIFHVAIYDGTSRYDLTPMEPTRFMERSWDTYSPSAPACHYAIVRHTETGIPCIAFSPIPGSACQAMIHYYRASSTLTDVIYMPEKWHTVLEDMALAKIYASFIRDPVQSAHHLGVAMNGVQQMVSENQSHSALVIGPESYRRFRMELVIDPYGV